MLANLYGGKIGNEENNSWSHELFNSTTQLLLWNSYCKRLRHINPNSITRIARCMPTPCYAFAGGRPALFAGYVGILLGLIKIPDTCTRECQSLLLSFPRIISGNLTTVFLRFPIDALGNDKIRYCHSRGFCRRSVRRTPSGKDSFAKGIPSEGASILDKSDSMSASKRNLDPNSVETSTANWQSGKVGRES